MFSTSSGRRYGTLTLNLTLEHPGRRWASSFHCLADVVKPSRQPKTYVTNADSVRLHLKPTLVTHELAKLSPQLVQALMSAKTPAGLSPCMVHHIRVVPRIALSQAMRWGLVARNAAALTEPPRQVRSEVVPLRPTEARALLTAVEGNRLAALVRVALTLGLRQGEVLGLS